MTNVPTPPLGSLVETIVPARDKPEDLGGPIPWLRIEDFDGKFVARSKSGQGVSAETIKAMNLRVFPAGTVICTCSCAMGTTAIASEPLITNQTFIGLLPRSSALDSSFLYWALQAYRPLLTSLATGAIQQYLSRDDFRGLRLPVPEPRVQRHVAAHLDAETARIDALIAKKRRMVDLLDERASLVLVDLMSNLGFEFPDRLALDRQTMKLPPGWQVMHLNQTLLRLTNGFVGPTRDILVDDGIRYVQSLHIKQGKIDFGRRPFFVEDSWHRERPRIHLRAGDVLIVQTGDIGQVAVVPEGFGEASCHALQIARVRPEVISGPFLGEYLRTPFAYQSLLSRATGALHPHLEGGIRDVPVVVPPLAVQEKMVVDAERRRSHLDTIASSVSAQITLLAERRQALITAAVTGQLPIPDVAA